MKKIVTLILVAVAMAAPSQAQIKFGAKAGLNLTEMSLNRSELEKHISDRTGFFIGPTVKLTVPITGLSFDGAALFDQREAKDKVSGRSLKQQSLQVPINVRYGVGLGSIVNVFAFAGPQFGFNIGDKSKTEGDTKWTLKSSNLSANFGVGTTILSHLQFTVNYNVAVGKTGEFKVNDAVYAKNRTSAWQIAAAYFF